VPRQRGSGNEFVNQVIEPPRERGQRVVPPKLAPDMIAAVGEGVIDALTRGPLLGYPMVDIEVRLVDGAYVEGDSSPVSFRAAASMGVMEAFERAEPRLFEPLMKIEVEVPEDFTGQVVNDLAGRHGRVMGLEPLRGLQVIHAEVPLAEMVGYATALRSATQG